MLCLGDSLTEGLTVEGMEEVLHPYSDLLGRLLAARLRAAGTAGNPADSARKKERVGTQECLRRHAHGAATEAVAIDLVNAGVSGECAAEMAPRLKAALCSTGRGSSGFTSAIVLAGTNDVRVASHAGGEPDVDAIVSDIRALLQICIDRGVAVASIGIPREQEEQMIPEKIRAAVNSRLRAAVAELSATSTSLVTFIDIDEVFGPDADESLWSFDLLHFSRAGSDALAEHLAAVLPAGMV